jgi:hypothetical protein
MTKRQAQSQALRSHKSNVNVQAAALGRTVRFSA